MDRIKKLLAWLILAMLLGSLGMSSWVYKTSATPLEILRISGPSYQPPPAGHYNVYIAQSVWPHSGTYRGLIVEPLIIFWEIPHDGQQYEPWLAESWQITNEGIRFKLRSGIEWSDGTPMTSKDIVSTFYIMKLIAYPVWTYIRSVEAVDNYTILFRTDNPKNPSLLYYISRTGISSYKVYGNFSDAVIAGANLVALNANFLAFRPSELIGSGAFKIESITASQIVLSKRENYWGVKTGFSKGLYIDKVVMYNNPGDAIRAQLELADQIDLDYGGSVIKGNMEAVLASGINASFVSYPAEEGTATFFNVKKYPFNIKEVRQALAYAVNTSMAALSTYPFVLQVEGEKHTSFGPGCMQVYLTREVINSLRSYTYNTTKAEATLRSLGWTRGGDGVWKDSNGTRMAFEMVIHAGWGSGRVNTHVAQQLTEFGIPITVRALDPATVADVIKGMQFDLVSNYWGGTDLANPYFSAVVWTYNTFTHGVPGLDTLFPSTYQWKGQLVNVTDLAFRLNMVEDAERKQITQTLAQIFNEYLPFLPQPARPTPMFINMQHLRWPLPYQSGKYTFPTYLIKSEDAAYWVLGGIDYITIKGLLNAPVPTPPPTPPPPAGIPIETAALMVSIAIIATAAITVVVVKKR